MLSLPTLPQTALSGQHGHSWQWQTARAALLWPGRALRCLQAQRAEALALGSAGPSELRDLHAAAARVSPGSVPELPRGSGT